MTADDDITNRMAEELRNLEPMELGLQPITVLQLTGLLQLALRHPGIDQNNRTTAEKFIVHARAYFANCPTVLDIVRRGDDPREDR